MKIAALERIQKLRGEIDKCVEREAELRAAAEKTTSLLSGMPIATPSAYSRVEEYSLKIYQIQETRRRLEFALVAAKVDFSEYMTSTIENKNIRQVIRKRYFEGKSWRAISAEMYYSTRQLLRFNREGLRRLEVFNS